MLFIYGMSATPPILPTPVPTANPSPSAGTAGTNSANSGQSGSSFAGALQDAGAGSGNAGAGPKDVGAKPPRKPAASKAANGGQPGGALPVAGNPPPPRADSGRPGRASHTSCASRAGCARNGFGRELSASRPRHCGQRGGNSRGRSRGGRAVGCRLDQRRRSRGGVQNRGRVQRVAGAARQPRCRHACGRINVGRRRGRSRGRRGGNSGGRGRCEGNLIGIGWRGFDRRFGFGALRRNGRDFALCGGFEQDGGEGGGRNDVSIGLKGCRSYPIAKSGFSNRG